jgi:hypothetical protein
VKVKAAQDVLFTPASMRSICSCVTPFGMSEVETANDPALPTSQLAGHVHQDGA